MKTKFTFLTLAIVALLGVVMLMAFKQEDTHKKYLLMTVSSYYNRVVITDENGVITEKSIKMDYKKMDWAVDVGLEINNICKNGYKLIETTNLVGYNTWNSQQYSVTQYIFEKE